MSDKPDNSFRVLHTADWHLGKLLNDQSRTHEHERFLEWLLQAVKEQEVDAIILAGDVFDSANPPQSALAQYFDFVAKLFQQGNCSLAVIAGNHDSAAQLESPRLALHALNTTVTGFLADDPSDRVLYLPNDQEPRVAIAMIPFLRDRDLRVGRAGENADEIREQIVKGIGQRYEEAAQAAKDAGKNCPVIATGHLTVLGAKTSDSERDIHIGGLGAVTGNNFSVTFDYVALGHLHRPQSIDESGRIRYAGSPIPLSFSETEDTKEVRLLDITKEDITQHSLPVPVFRRLNQIRTTNAALEQTLEDFNPDAGDLRTWVEVVVEDATLEDDLNSRVHEKVKDRDFEVLKVLRGRKTTIVGMNAGEASDDEAIESLLDNPDQVFDHLLKEHPDLDEKDTKALQDAFAQLVDLHSQNDEVKTS